MVNSAITSAINGDNEFSFESLLVYNAMMNELLPMPAMPENATAGCFREIREFITHFVRRCNEKQIGVTYLEPMVIANIVASFNSVIFVQWKLQMIHSKASLKSIRSFLADQEELATDKRNKVNNFTLASAIKAAKQMVNKDGGATPKSEGQSLPSVDKSPNDKVSQKPKQAQVKPVTKKVPRKRATSKRAMTRKVKQKRVKRSQ